MGSNDSPQDERATAAERKLRGGALRGSEQKSAVDHTAYEETRDPDAELHADGEDESLYGDGVDVGEESDTLAGTRGNSSGIKP